MGGAITRGRYAFSTYPRRHIHFSTFSLTSFHPPTLTLRALHLPLSTFPPTHVHFHPCTIPLPCGIVHRYTLSPSPLHLFCLALAFSVFPFVYSFIHLPCHTGISTSPTFLPHLSSVSCGMSSTQQHRANITPHIKAIANGLKQFILQHWFVI